MDLLRVLLDFSLGPLQEVGLALGVRREMRRGDQEGGQRGEAEGGREDDREGGGARVLLQCVC